MEYVYDEKDYGIIVVKVLHVRYFLYLNSIHFKIVFSIIYV